MDPKAMVCPECNGNAFASVCDGRGNAACCTCDKRLVVTFEGNKVASCVEVKDER